MCSVLQGAFSQLLEANKWMDGTTKAAARMKLDAMGRKIGAPIKWKSECHAMPVPLQWFN